MKINEQFDKLSEGVNLTYLKEGYHLNTIKKIFLKNDGVFSINGYKNASFYYDINYELDFHRDLKVAENIRYMKDNGVNYIYYEVSGYDIIFRECLNELKKPTESEKCELRAPINFKRLPEFAEMILDDHKILFLLRAICKDGAEASVFNILKLASFFSDSNVIKKRLIENYIIKICDDYGFYKINNVKYFEFLLVNKLSMGRLVFNAQENQIS